jgi:hypothetical protein
MPFFLGFEQKQKTNDLSQIGKSRPSLLYIIVLKNKATALFAKRELRF